ncbi:MAG: ABC transporter ATP-binding protein [Armatimonadota bacterium]|nr:ABC transporter ATP-binding protein [Armatimonadota bacterium]MDR7450312.1 ABC transporter ATP-binding protein [Armatimonadota bacterium]MDR7467105.1 ABC transporter ATP-binding protein [Armatimonadota bacterium]MDR7493353.1 ABC transporter ATP-binding protein [Armatimonadota bacterium]MDR7499361.1 ABC transporter ATP-binding protein [Armatimonadota bacterium]
MFGPTVAVDGISFQVRRGELLGFLGPNGAGKTTTIAMLLGLIAPTAGTVHLLGLPMPARRGAILGRVNFSSPYVALPYDLLVWENLVVFSHLYGVGHYRRKIEELAGLFGVTHLLHRRTGSLSSGETARVNLVKAFLNDPEILFLDEPTAALDPEAADTVRALLLRQRERAGLTIFYTSHNMREVQRLSTRIIFLHRGRVLADGPAEEVVRQYGKTDLEEFFVALARSERAGQPP